MTVALTKVTGSDDHWHRDTHHFQRLQQLWRHCVVRGRLSTPPLHTSTILRSCVQILSDEMGTCCSGRHLRDRIHCLRNRTNVQCAYCRKGDRRNWRCRNLIWSLCPDQPARSFAVTTQIFWGFGFGVWHSLHHRSNSWRILDCSDMALVFLDQCSYWGLVPGPSSLPHTKRGPASQVSRYLARKVQPIRPTGIYSDRSINRVLTFCHGMGRYQICLEQWPHHRTICGLWCCRYRFHCISNLAQRSGDSTSKDLLATQHLNGSHSEYRYRIGAGIILFLPANLVSSRPGKVGAKFWLISHTAALKRRVCSHWGWYCNERSRILRSIHDCGKRHSYRWLGTYHDVGT